MEGFINVWLDGNGVVLEFNLFLGVGEQSILKVNFFPIVSI